MRAFSLLIYVLKCSFTITTDRKTFFHRILTLHGRLEFEAKYDEFDQGPAACEGMSTRYHFLLSEPFVSHMVIIYTAYQ